MAIATLHEQRVTDQDLNNALRGAFLEGFKEGTSISQRSMFASVFLDNLLERSQTTPTDEELRDCWVNASAFVSLGQPKKATNETIQTAQ